MVTLSPTGVPTSLPTSAPTHIPIIRIGAEYYLYNSTSCGVISDVTSLAIGNIALGAVVLIWSFYLKKMKFTTIRILIDMCAIGAILQGSLYLAWMHTQSPDDIFANVFYLDIGVIGIGGFLVQFPDDFIFALGGWHIYHKEVRTFWFVLLFIYVLFANYFSWILQYTFFPFLFNTNAAEFYEKYYKNGLYIYTIGEATYFILASMTFLKTLYDVNVKKTKSVQLYYQVFALKCCVHMLSSTTAVVVLYTQVDYFYGILIYNIHVLISLHLLFNANVIEYFCLPKKKQENAIAPHSTHSNRGIVSYLLFTSNKVFPLPLQRALSLSSHHSQSNRSKRYQTRASIAGNSAPPNGISTSTTPTTAGGGGAGAGAGGGGE